MRVLSLAILAAAALLLAFLAVSFVASLIAEGRAEGVAALVGAGGRPVSAGADGGGGSGSNDSASSKASPTAPVMLWRRVRDAVGDEWWVCDATGASAWDLPPGAAIIDGSKHDDARGSESLERGSGGGSSLRPFVAPDTAAVEAGSGADAALSAVLRSALSAEETREARHAELPHAVSPLHAAPLNTATSVTAAASSRRARTSPDGAREEGAAAAGAVRDDGIRDSVRKLVASVRAHEAKIERKRGARATKR